MKKKSFDVIVQEQFKFLETEYNFSLPESRKEGWGYKLTYLNETTGVDIVYEYREGYIFITLYQLVNGALQENPTFIEDDTILYGYGLDDIIILRNSKAIIKPTYEYGEESKYHDEENGLTNYVADFAENLKTYAKDVLIGDFTIFPELDKIVKERVRSYYNNL